MNAYSNNRHRSRNQFITPRSSAPQSGRNPAPRRGSRTATPTSIGKSTETKYVTRSMRKPAVREVTLRDPGPARELLLREVALFPQPPYKSMVGFSTRHSALVVPAARRTRPAAATTTRPTRHHGSVLESAVFFSALDSPHVLVRSPAARPRGLYWGLTPVRFSAATHPTLPLDAPSRTRTPTRSVHGDLESGSSCTLVPGSR